MFGEIDKLEEMRKKVDAVSPSFCMAKWMHVTIHLLNGRTHSCYLPQTHPIPLGEIRENPSALHNTRYKKQQRKKMLKGERPEECGICWDIEDLPGNQLSDRRLRSVDSWTLPYLDKIRALPWDADINPTYVEVSFSSLCNFKCSYCSPHVSSSWMEEVKKQGPYPLSQGSHQDLQWLEKSGLMPLDEDDNPYIETFWRWWPDLIKTLQFFRITGGEPLLSKDTFRVLEWLNENPQPHLELQVNSNLGVPDRFLDRFMELSSSLLREKKIKRLMVHTSLDTFGQQAEYIRNGLDFAVFERNVNRYLTDLPTASIAFMCAFNNLSVVGFRKYLDWIVELRARHARGGRPVLLDLPHLVGPRHQAANILTEDYRERMGSLIVGMQAQKDKSDTFMQAEIEKMKRILEWMSAPVDAKWLKGARRDFYLFFCEHDRRRQTDFLKTFPEMGEFWELCRGLVSY